MGHPKTPIWMMDRGEGLNPEGRWIADKILYQQSETNQGLRCLSIAGALNLPCCHWHVFLFNTSPTHPLQAVRSHHSRVQAVGFHYALRFGGLHP